MRLVDRASHTSVYVARTAGLAGRRRRTAKTRKNFDRGSDDFSSMGVEFTHEVWKGSNHLASSLDSPN